MEGLALAPALFRRKQSHPWLSRAENRMLELWPHLPSWSLLREKICWQWISGAFYISLELSSWLSRAKDSLVWFPKSLTAVPGTNLDSGSWRYHHFVEILPYGPSLMVYLGLYLEHTEHASKEEKAHTQSPFDLPSSWLHKSTLFPVWYISLLDSILHFPGGSVLMMDFPFSCRAWPCAGAPFYSLLCFIQYCGYFPCHDGTCLPAWMLMLLLTACPSFPLTSCP